MNMPYARPITGTDNDSNPQAKALLNEIPRKKDSTPLTAKSSRVKTIQQTIRINKKATISTICQLYFTSELSFDPIGLSAKEFIYRLIYRLIYRVIYRLITGSFTGSNTIDLQKISFGLIFLGSSIPDLICFK